MDVEGKVSERKYPDADTSKQLRPHPHFQSLQPQRPPQPSLSTASPDVVRSLLTFLHPSDLARVFPCSRFLATFQRDDFLYTSLLTSIFLNPRPPLPAGYHPEPSPYALFRQYHSEYPPHYWPHYPAIHALYQQLRAVLEERAPWIAQSLNAGLSEEEVTRTDAGLGTGNAWSGQGKGRLRVAGCADWLLFLKMANGQRKWRRGDWAGLWGTIQFYGTVVNVSSRLLHSHRWPSSLPRFSHPHPPSPPPLSAVQLRLSSLQESLRGYVTLSRSLPISTSPNSNEHLQFFIQPTGQVIRGRARAAPLHIVAPSFTAFLSGHVERLRSGVYAIKQPTRGPEQVAGISRFAFPDPCGSDCVTRGIRVQTSVLFVVEASDSRRSRFTYRIRLTHTGETNVDATLTTRRWIITNGNGHEEIVEGPGVIGFHPVTHRTSRAALSDPYFPSFLLLTRCAAVSLSLSLPPALRLL